MRYRQEHTINQEIEVKRDQSQEFQNASSASFQIQLCAKELKL